MNTFLTGFSWLVLGYFLALQVILLLLAIVSGIVLYRDRMVERFARVEDMLASDLAPPVSIVVPAYNEAAGIVEAIRSMGMVSYPRFEIVVANDGSTDATLSLLIEAFELVPVPYPLRANIPTAPIRQVYKSRLPIRLTVVDKENGGRADALNAAINAARYPYVLATDADVIIDGSALVHAMRLVAEDRDRTVGVGGNVRPINGCRVRHGHLVDASVPATMVERYQLLEYLRSFIASRPAWSSMNCLPLLSGAFGVFRRDVVVDVGGYTSGHFGEDMDLTMRVHRYLRARKVDYRMVYSPSAIVWTEVPPTRAVLRRQRIRWHRGLMTAVRDFRSSFFNPRHGPVGMISWPVMVVFEYLAPIVEFLGYIVVPVAMLAGAVSPINAIGLYLIAVFAGAFNSLIAILLDERFGYFNNPRETLKLMAVVFVENLGLRQMTVWWRIRAMMGGKATQVWGDMERRGVTQMAS
ncbi:MAG TPA: glycosyltransferase family 2 protein [Acidimicrobiia bacterium]|nr:glycosyltransferase family 2 protein [Acidimicrobiia bacterium]